MNRNSAHGNSAHGDGVQCPYCGEWIDVYVDTGGAADQDYVEDCSVCCRPIRMVVSIDFETGETLVNASSDV